MGWNGIERNRMDFILTDLLPVELSELFSFTPFYSFLLEKQQQKVISQLVEKIKEKKSIGNDLMFQNSWSTKPLKYNILKGLNSTREMSIVQPLSALNIFLFMECYQKIILDFLEKNHSFSIRYHKKNTNLFYKTKSKAITQYFQKESTQLGKNIIQQTGSYFKTVPFESINAFTDSKIWRICNFKYKCYAKIDYKSCFDSIYTHAYSWIIERNVIDSKAAKNSNIFMAIDRLLQNINGRSSNGIVVGPEFSRMIAEVLLQRIDYEVTTSLSSENIFKDKDYSAFRYVDDIFLFANEDEVLDKIINKFKVIGGKYLLKLNELKLARETTPCVPKEWLKKTRELSDTIGNCFYNSKTSEYKNLPEDSRFIVKSNFISVDRIKDEISSLIKAYPEDKRTIVSFLLSTLLNNFSQKKDGYPLFDKKKLGKSLLFLDLTLFIYAFYPSFDQTRKIISIISYMNKEVNFKSDSKAHSRLLKAIKLYSFIFQSGNLFDLCDWFPFFCEYSISLDSNTETILIEKAKKCNDPIIWANLLLYSKYYKNFYDELKSYIESVIKKQLLNISDDEQFLQVEIWYVFIFHNCPYISISLRNEMAKIINDIYKNTSKKSQPSSTATKLVCDFLQLQSSTGNKPAISFFNWKGEYNFSEQVTYRTYQRTIFKRYKKNKNWLYASIE